LARWSRTPEKPSHPIYCSLVTRLTAVQRRKTLPRPSRAEVEATANKLRAGGDGHGKPRSPTPFPPRATHTTPYFASDPPWPSRGDDRHSRKRSACLLQPPGRHPRRGGLVNLPSSFAVLGRARPRSICSLQQARLAVFGALCNLDILPVTERAELQFGGWPIVD
jgi:hypothetical protein